MMRNSVSSINTLLTYFQVTLVQYLQVTIQQNECHRHHHFVIIIKVVNDATSCTPPVCFFAIQFLLLIFVTRCFALVLLKFCRLVLTNQPATCLDRDGAYFPGRRRKNDYFGNAFGHASAAFRQAAAAAAKESRNKKIELINFSFFIAAFSIAA